MKNDKKGDGHIGAVFYRGGRGVKSSAYYVYTLAFFSTLSKMEAEVMDGPI